MVHKNFILMFVLILNGIFEGLSLAQFLFYCLHFLIMGKMNLFQILIILILIYFNKSVLSSALLYCGFNKEFVFIICYFL